jgi:hypothetical protein
LGASSDSIPARRAWLALSFGLAALALVGCGLRSPAGRYEKDGLTFEHLEGWSVTKDAQQRARTVTVVGPGHALLTISVFPPHVKASLEPFVATVTKARSAALERKLTVAGVNLGAEAGTTAPTPIERSVAGTRAHGLEVHFTVELLNVHLPHTAEFLMLTIGDRTLIVMDQVPDKGRDPIAAGFQKILDTISLGP